MEAERLSWPDRKVPSNCISGAECGLKTMGLLVAKDMSATSLEGGRGHLASKQVG